MTTNSGPPADVTARRSTGPRTAAWFSPATTTEERLQRIAALGERVNKYVQFICGSCGLPGTSGEARDRAVTAFYERLLALERQLGRIEEDFRLG